MKKMLAKCIFCRGDVPVGRYARVIFDVGSQYSYIAHWECLSTEVNEEAYVVDYSNSRNGSDDGTASRVA